MKITSPAGTESIVNSIKFLRRLTAIAILAWLSIFPNSSLAAQQGYVSIAELREEAKAGISKTYEAHGRTINVDCDIIVPDVQKVPVLRVNPLPSPITETQMENPYFYTYGRMQQIVGQTEKTNRVPGIGYIMPDGIAEGNPFTPETAKEFVLRTVHDAHDAYQNIDFVLFGQVGHSRQYAEKNETEHSLSDENVNLDVPLNDAGDYELLFCQQFAGMPVYPWRYFDMIDSNSLSRQYIQPQIWANVYNEQDYLISVASAVQDETVVEDIPLVPFEKVQTALEEAIYSGRLREVYAIRLMYFPLYEQTAKDESMLLFPVWVVTGDIYETAKKETTTLWGNYGLRNRAMGESCFIIDAQTGELLDRWSKNIDLMTIHPILRWEDVR
jgi:hypothetical protein